MTTIATDGRTMAGDGLCLDGGDAITSLDIVKVRRLKNGGIVGVAGSAFDIDAFVDWLDGPQSEPPKDMWEKTEALALMPDGRCYFYNDKGKRFETSLPAVTGSGSDLAMGAMAAGKSPAEAVEIACANHASSGGTITALSLENITAMRAA